MTHLLVVSLELFCASVAVLLILRNLQWVGTLAILLQRFGPGAVFAEMLGTTSLNTATLRIWTILTALTSLALITFDKVSLGILLFAILLAWRWLYFVARKWIGFASLLLVCVLSVVAAYAKTSGLY
jgi:hypothetical protein